MGRRTSRGSWLETPWRKGSATPWRCVALDAPSLARIERSRAAGVTRSDDGTCRSQPRRDDLEPQIAPFHDGTAVARDAVTMMPAAPSTSGFTSTTASFWRRRVPSRVVAGVVSATVLACASGIEIARAWTDSPHVAAEPEQAAGGLLVALFTVAAIGLGMRNRVLASAAVPAVFGLVAHGGVLVLEGELVGALFLGIAPVVALLAHATFANDELMETAAARDAVMRATMLALWLKTSRKRTARAAAPAASPIPLAMRASQATIIDVWETTPSSS